MPDPLRPNAFFAEREPAKDLHGHLSIVDVSTVLLAASQCPIGCNMCDLHLNTLPGPTDIGAIPNQIQIAQEQLPPAPWIKLYNSGNFFDVASIPPADHDAIALLCNHSQNHSPNGYQRIIVENHPRFGKHRHAEFRDRLRGQLEIAVGLESVQPRVLQRMNKQMTRDEFDRYARMLKETQIDLRVFLIVGTPGASVTESLRWARLSIRHAVLAGARHISLIPARRGHGWNGQSDSLPDITLRPLADLFAAAIDDLQGATCLSVDLWDFSDHPQQDRDLIARLNTAILCQSAANL